MKKFAFMQDWGTYSNQTLVVVGMNKKEIVKHLKKIKAPKDAIASFLVVEESHFHEAAFVWSNFGRTVLWLPSWQHTAKNEETLVHEVHHLIFDVMNSKGMADEPEALAYQMEFLFKNIRKNLWKYSRNKK